VASFAAPIHRLSVDDVLAMVVVVVHRDPVGGAYATVTEHRDGELQPLLDAPPLPLHALFGRA